MNAAVVLGSMHMEITAAVQGDARMGTYCSVCVGEGERCRCVVQWSGDICVANGPGTPDPHWCGLRGVWSLLVWPVGCAAPSHLEAGQHCFTVILQLLGEGEGLYGCFLVQKEHRGEE